MSLGPNVLADSAEEGHGVIWSGVLNYKLDDRVYRVNVLKEFFFMFCSLYERDVINILFHNVVHLLTALMALFSKISITGWLLWALQGIPWQLLLFLHIFLEIGK